jgi:hypothetical protein
MVTVVAGPVYLDRGAAKLFMPSLAEDLIFSRLP